MTAYLGKRFDTADPAEQGLFSQLVDMPDPELYDLLIGRCMHAEDAVNRLAETIRNAADLT